MKKLLSLFFIVCLCSTYAFAVDEDEAINELGGVEAEEIDAASTIPIWSEFCPKKFLNADALTTKEYNQLQKFIKAEQSRVDEYNQDIVYWKNRRQKFEYFLETCSQFPSDKQEACYQRVRDRELRLTKEYGELKALNNLIGADAAAKRKLYQDSCIMMNADGMQMMTNMLQMAAPAAAAKESTHGPRLESGQEPKRFFQKKSKQNKNGEQSGEPVED